ncbi:MAG: hypothetical protein ACYC64_01230 [Armatimonadota bacterium]
MKNKILTSLVPAVILALALASGVSATNYAMESYAIGSGGADMASASYAMVATLGQDVAGNASSASYCLQAGFLFSEGPSTPPTVINWLDEAKALADGTNVQVSGKVATTDSGDFSGFFYIEEADRSSGIRVGISSVAGILTKGKTVSLTGTIATTASGEREISNAVVTVGGSTTALTPLGTNNKSLAGGNLGNPASGVGQYGVADGAGSARFR